jgi:RHS repeat-associated protein
LKINNKLTDLTLYGSSRLGINYVDRIVTNAATGNPSIGERLRSQKTYELSNHLGNVLTTITDRKLGISNTTNGPLNYYKPEYVSVTDYDPFGMQLNDRVLNSGSNRYGFNGKENDNEVKGDGNQQDYGFRIYDPRLGRFLSVDPLTKSYPELTPYQFASNTPIQAIDLDGLEAAYKWGEGKLNSTLPSIKKVDYYTTQAEATNKIFGVYNMIKNAPLKQVEDGYFTSETHTYIIVMKSTFKRFEMLKNTYTNRPKLLNNNKAATYYPIDSPYDNDTKLEKGDGMIIDIGGPFNGAVRFTDVQTNNTSFKLTAQTLDLGSPIPFVESVVTGNTNLNHPDAGEITFAGSFNPSDNTISFSITNTTTLGNWATALLKCVSRYVQEGQWNTVMENIEKFISKNQSDLLFKVHGKDNEPIDNYLPKK